MKVGDKVVITKILSEHDEYFYSVGTQGTIKAKGYVPHSYKVKFQHLEDPILCYKKQLKKVKEGKENMQLKVIPLFNVGDIVSYHYDKKSIDEYNNMKIIDVKLEMQNNRNYAVEYLCEMKNKERKWFEECTIDTFTMGNHYK